MNPNAPLFIPAAVRQVEDFSPEWWELINTAAWFRDYWLSQHQGENGFYDNYEDEFVNNDVVDLLPDSIDLGVDEDLLNMEEQFEEFIRSSKSGETYLSPSSFKVPRNDLTADVEAMTRTLRLSKSFNDKSPKSLDQRKYWAKPAKHVSPRCSPRRIQQPR